MKILWVCNIMLPIIAEKLGVEGSNKEGWLSGLCDIMLERRQENEIELHVAYPVGKEADGSFHELVLPEKGEGTVLYAYGFYEDIAHAETYDEELEKRLSGIINRVKPDVIHCFGTEFAHTLAVARCSERPERVLVGIQGLCQVIARAYMADLPEEIQDKVTFRDWLKKDSLQQQQQKFIMRGQREEEVVKLVGNVTGRTAFDRYYTEKWNPDAEYFSMNETLRSCFYEGQWSEKDCEPHTIFMSQGDYPLKGLHYMLLAAGQLQKRYPDLRIKIAGNSLVNFRSIKDKIKISAYGLYLRRLIEQLQLKDRVAFLGRLTAQEMKEEYLKSGLYICCSSNENSPNSLGEAMLLGVPCVAADVGGISSIFTHGVDGILYEGFRLPAGKNGKEDKNNTCNREKARYCDVREDVSADLESGLNMVVSNLRNAIVQMWDNPEARSEYCKNARLHARKTHDKEINYRKMMEIYSKIASK